MNKRFKVVIEHLEPCINRWLLKEYEYVANLYRSRLIITNVTNSLHKDILSNYAKIQTASVTEILKNYKNVIVLDPKAKTPLEPVDLEVADYVILGGIMGSHPPKGRTWLYITSKLPQAEARHIGPYQYTIAGAAYVLKSIELGKKLNDIKFVYGLTISKKLSNGIESEIHLPYAFPLDDYGKIVLPDDYIKIIAEHMPIYEHRILLNGSKDSIC